MLQAVAEGFVAAYNAFGIAKRKHRVPVTHKGAAPAKRLHKFQDPTRSVLDFL